MKNIVMTNEAIEAACERLRAQLSGVHIPKDKIDISVPTKIIIPDEQKPTILVSVIADRKMRALVQQCDKEIGWHGSVRYEEDINTYIVEDIFVFPQEITGTTVQSIDEVYGLWLMEFDDETFDKLRLHGHSHVNMGTTPSGVDTAYQETLTDRVQDFYIFVILNKRDDYYVCLFDVANNLMYEKDDLYYDAEIEEVDAWAKDNIAKHVKAKTYTVPAGSMAARDFPKFPVVLKSYRQGWAWNIDAQGYIPSTDKALQDYLMEQDELTQKNKRGPGRPRRNQNKGAYEEYQQQKVAEIAARNKAKSEAAYQNCEGNCIACATPCAYAGYNQY